MLAELDAEASPTSTPNMACRFGDSASELLEVLGGAGFQEVLRDDVQVTRATVQCRQVASWARVRRKAVLWVGDARQLA